MNRRVRDGWLSAGARVTRCVRPLAFAGACVGLGAAGGCALAAKPGETPADGYGHPGGLEAQEATLQPGDLEGYERLLASAEHRLGAELEGAASAGSRRDTQPWAPSPASPSATASAPVWSGAGESPTGPAPALAPAGVATADSEAAGADASSEGAYAGCCDAACRALGSMARAAEGICRIAGASHDRCVEAHSRVEGAGERLRRAGCHCEPR